MSLFVLIDVILLSVIFSLFSPLAKGDVGENVTVSTYLNVGEVSPELLNVSIQGDAASVTLIANDTKIVSCVGLARDWNNDTDITSANAEFFDTVASSYGGGDDNNEHYTNDSCNINYSFVSWNGISDNNYTALVNCTYKVHYYANPQNWNCTMVVNDSIDWTDIGSDNISISQLLAVGLPDSINYGTVNATSVSNENITNVTNYGNVDLNLSLSGYAVNVGDGNAMNCTLGTLKNISIEYEKYNLTTSIPGVLTLSEFESNYTNLTESPVVNGFDLDYRQDDSVNNAKNETYWRIYVPEGVAGTCSGNIVFGATTAGP